MNLFAAIAIITGFWLMIHWFGTPAKKKGKVVKMDDSESFYHK